LVPVLLGNAVERGEHDGHDDLVVLLDQGHDVFVIPKIQSPLCNLEKKDVKMNFFNGKVKIILP